MSLILSSEVFKPQNIIYNKIATDVISLFLSKFTSNGKQSKPAAQQHKMSLWFLRQIISFLLLIGDVT